MNYEKRVIKDGITVHTIKTNKFKTDLIAVTLTTKLDKENVTKNALIPMILRKGSAVLENTEEINKELEDMYGATFDCGVDKNGDNQVLKFYLETIDNEYLPNTEDLMIKAINTLLDLAFDPKIENNAFKEDYMKSEKGKLKILIEGKKDNKAQYANLRCQEEMFKGTPFGLFKYGYIEDLEQIDGSNLYEYYKDLISKCKIDIFVSGNINPEDITKRIEQNENIKKLNEREPEYNKKNIPFEKHNERKITETAEVTQGNLIIGLSISEIENNEKYSAMLYNAILGGSATSKMFQIVREKNSLAYTAVSTYLKHKNSIFIKCGIEISNYEKTLKLIKEQIEDMKKGNFTDEDIESSRTGIIANIKMIPEEQETEMTYHLGQELAGYTMSYEEYEEKVKNVTREDILKFAEKVSVDTIYFLTNEERKEE